MNITLPVPVIVTDTGMKIAQTQAIVHYLGRAAGLDCDCEDYTLCEVFALGTGMSISYLSVRLYKYKCKLV